MWYNKNLTDNYGFSFICKYMCVKLHSSHYMEFSSIKPELEQLSWRFWRKRRYIVVLMSFCGFFNVYSLRVNLSVAIVAMSENRTVHYANGTMGHVCVIWLFSFLSFLSSTHTIFYAHFKHQMHDDLISPIGASICMGLKRSRTYSELILLGLYTDAICWRRSWIKSWW